MCLVIGVIDRDQQLVFRKAIFLGDQVPGEFNRVFLEIVAERKVAEHFKEGVMACGMTDIFKVVMLAPGAHAFLRGRGTRIIAVFLAGENVLELNHPGVGEHQGRVIARHQRAGRNDFVAVLAEELQKRGADIVDGLHISPTRKTRNNCARHTGERTALFSGSALPCPVRRKESGGFAASFAQFGDLGQVNRAKPSQNSAGFQQ